MTEQPAGPLEPSSTAGPWSDLPDASVARWGLGDVVAGIAASLVLAFVVGSVIYVVAGWSSSAEVPVWGLALLQVPLWAGYLGVTLWATSAKGGGVVRDLGVSMRWYDAPLGMVIGVVTQLLVLPLLYLPIFELTGTDGDELSEPARELAGRASGTASWLLFALLVGVGAPIVEELFYRGLFLRSLAKRGLPRTAAVLISAAVFAAIHFQWLQFAGLFVFGAVAGTLAARSGRLGGAIWAHIGFNLTTVVVLWAGA